MDLLQLRYFRTVARLEHMTQAAQELSISQSSLSKTIIHLEHELGVSLFDRQGRKIQLNQYGKAFLRRIEQVFATLDDGQRELADLAEGKQGYERDAANFESGSEGQLEILHMAASEGLAYWVGFQRAITHLRGKPEAVPFNLRVTELFRREGDTWKLIHRHVDSLLSEPEAKQP